MTHILWVMQSVIFEILKILFQTWYFASTNQHKVFFSFWFIFEFFLNWPVRKCTTPVPHPYLLRKCNFSLSVFSLTWLTKEIDHDSSSWETEKWNWRPVTWREKRFNQSEIRTELLNESEHTREIWRVTTKYAKTNIGKSQ